MGFWYFLPHLFTTASRGFRSNLLLSSRVAFQLQCFCKFRCDFERSVHLSLYSRCTQRFFTRFQPGFTRLPQSTLFPHLGKLFPTPSASRKNLLPFYTFDLEAARLRLSIEPFLSGGCATCEQHNFFVVQGVTDEPQGHHLFTRTKFLCQPAFDSRGDVILKPARLRLRTAFSRAM